MKANTIEEKQFVKIKNTWAGAGAIGEVLGPHLMCDQAWTPVLWEGDVDPSLFKTSGLEEYYPGKVEALNKKLLLGQLPEIGQYIKAYFSGVPNDVFPESKLKEFIKIGKLDDNLWKLTKAVRSQEVDIKFEVRIEILR